MGPVVQAAVVQSEPPTQLASLVLSGNIFGWILEEKNLKLSHLTLPKAQFPMDVAEEGRGRFVVAQDRFRCVTHPRCVASGEGEEVCHVQGIRVQRVLLQD